MEDLKGKRFIIIWNTEGFIESYEAELSKRGMIFFDVFKQKSKKALQAQNKLRSRDRYVSVHAFIKELFTELSQLG